MSSMIERYQLRYFLAVVDAGNFSRAAAQVNVTQPTLSVGVAKLEETLGAKLFLRNSQRVHLTEAGVRLLAHARTIESEFNGLENLLAAPEQQPVLRVGVLSTIPTRLIEQVIAANAAAERPDALEIVEGVERDLISRLQRGRIDLALTIVRPGERRFPSEVLFREGYAVAAPAAHPCTAHAVVAGESLAQETMIVRRHCEVLPETSRHFTERGVRPRFSYRSTNDDRALALVRAGLGITIMPRSYADPCEAWPSLAGFDHVRDIGILFADETSPVSGRPGLAALRSLKLQGEFAAVLTQVDAGHGLSRHSDRSDRAKRIRDGRQD